jgi:NadR type nicotinamide-nucleotide adenylyltransferase
MAKIKTNDYRMKVVITGPESTGKSWLSKALARHYDIPLVEEYARLFLKQTKGEYRQEDLIEIAKGQIALEDQVTLQKPKFILCDTDLEVIRVWSEWKYDACDPWILEKAKEKQADLYLLLKPDVPWFPDPLRENPNDREALFLEYQKVLAEYDSKVIEIGDYWQYRFHASIMAIDLRLKG